MANLTDPNREGFYRGKRLKSLGLNELSKIKAQVKILELGNAKLEDFKQAAKWRDKYHEVVRVFQDSLLGVFG